ncbi:MAG: PASTA domain-containing protein [Nitrososphaeraceae archaeon]
MNSKEISLILAVAIMANISHVQLFQPGTGQLVPYLPNPETSSPSSLPSISSPLPGSSNTSSPLPEGAVTITSPTAGEQVPIGQDLTVTGTSIANSDSGCKINVNLNRARPSQPATATGPGGPDDYSEWSAILTSNYTSIQEGENRIGARISCGSDSTLRQFTSVNVTGVPP